MTLSLATVGAGLELDGGADLDGLGYQEVVGELGLGSKELFDGFKSVFGCAGFAQVHLITSLLMKADQPDDAVQVITYICAEEPLSSTPDDTVAMRRRVVHAITARKGRRALRYQLLEGLGLKPRGRQEWLDMILKDAGPVDWFRLSMYMIRKRRKSG